MKFLHCSDIHLGRKPVGATGDYSIKRYNDYFAAFDYAVSIAIERKVDLFIVAGDLFDKKELQPEVLERTELILIKLKQAGIIAVVIEGNHDNITAGRESESWIIYLKNKGLLKRPYVKFEEGEYRFYPLEINGLNIYGLGYPGLFADEIIGKLAEHLDGTNPDKNIVLVHTAIAGHKLMTGTVEFDTISKLTGKAIYIAGGHFHYYSNAPKELPIFFAPGSLEYWELGEHSQMKGMVIFDTDTKNYEFVESKKRTVQYYNFVTDAANENEFLDEFRSFIDSIRINENEDIVKIDISNKNRFYVDTVKCEEMLKEKGVLKASVEIKTQLTGDTISLLSTVTSVGQIEREVISGWKDFSAHLDSTTDTLDKMKKNLEEEQFEIVHELFDGLLERILGEGGNDENQ